MKADLKEQVVITGPGRSGTTFLVELLTHLGLDTGYKVIELDQHKSTLVHAGLEHKVGTPDGPTIVKDPWFCDYAASILNREDFKITHVFVPIRDLKAVAGSRRVNSEKQFKALSIIDQIKYRIWPYPMMGGLWGTQSMRKGVQERILAEKLNHMLTEVAKHQIPVTFIQFPLLIQSADYLYEKLKPILSQIPIDKFQPIFHQLVQPELLHNYEKR